MVVNEHPADTAGGGGVIGSAPTTGRDEHSFRSMITNAVTRQVRRSFANGPTGVDREIVVPTDEMLSTAQNTQTTQIKQSTAEKMEILNAKQQQQQQQVQQQLMCRVTSLESMDYEAMGISMDQSQLSSTSHSKSESKTDV